MRSIIYILSGVIKKAYMASRIHKTNTIIIIDWWWILMLEKSNMRRTGSIIIAYQINDQIIISNRVRNDVLYKDGMSNMAAVTFYSKDFNRMFTIKEINMPIVISMKVPIAIVA